MVLLSSVLYPYSYSDTLSEYDLYVTALGLWHGEVSGQGLQSPLHYYPSLSFGYILLVYLIAPDGVLSDGAKIIGLMNQIGYFSTIALMPSLWLMLRSLYSIPFAAAAALIFIFSPIFLEIAGGGHPLLPALALFFPGAALMFYFDDQHTRIAAWAIATIFLALALIVRPEVALAFPFLVLAQPRCDNLRRYLTDALARTLPCIASLAAFFAVRALLIDTPVETQASSFVQSGTAWPISAKGLSRRLSL